MYNCNLSKDNLLLFLIIYIFIIISLIINTPFTYSEANILFSNDFTIESFLVKGIYNYNKSYIFLRTPFFLISIISLYLYFKILIKYFKKWSKYYNLSIFIYMLTPGIFLSFALVNNATIPIFLTLLLIYSYEEDIKLGIFISLLLLLLTHSAQFVVYVALIVTSYKDKKLWITLLSLVLLLLSSFISTYSIGGIPKGHLLQLFGIYSAIFSPLLFIFIIYVIYKSIISKKKDLLINIIITAFILSILLSIRQKVKITDFSVFLIIAIPIAIIQFRNSIQVRLREYRKTYYIICNITIIVLLIETTIISLHYPLYKYFDKKVWLIDYNIYKIQDIAKDLKNSETSCKKVISNKEENLYKYYGIVKCK